MKDTVDIRALAKLARLAVSDDEVKALEREVPHILEFVEAIQSVDVPTSSHESEHRNVFRADEEPHEGGVFTEKLLASAPARQGRHVAVKQVIKRK